MTECPHLKVEYRAIELWRWQENRQVAVHFVSHEVLAEAVALATARAGDRMT